MKKIYLIVIFSLIGISFGSIRVGMVQYTSCLDTAEYTVDAIENMLDSFPDIDVIIAPDGALAGSRNKARIIFGKNDSGDIIFAPADTTENSHNIFLCLTAICSLAATYGVTIIPGTVWEVDSSYRVFCTAPIISPDGTIKRLRRKAHQYRCDDKIDSTIHIDTVITADSSVYTYFLTITNESRDIPSIYTHPFLLADIWFCLENHWFDNAGLAAQEFESDTYPNYYIVRTSFDDDLFHNFYSNWLEFESPVFVSEMSPFSGAFWLQNLADSLLPDNMWYRMDFYDDLSYGIVAECNPDAPSLFTEIKEMARPKEIELNVHPNPFNSSCKISVETYDYASLPTTIAIYDIMGNVVYQPPIPLRRDLSPLIRGTDRSVSDGQGVIIWTPDKSVPSGIYFVRVTEPINSTVHTKRIVYIK
ncbi:hypothetical protein DRQ26_02405 [bacterium]|nr:MAG: hypothetical protein DRQ26_02405 [bacterium]